MDQPEHPHSLIVPLYYSLSLRSIIYAIHAYTLYISRFTLVSVAELTSSTITLIETPKIGFPEAMLNLNVTAVTLCMLGI